MLCTATARALRQIILGAHHDEPPGARDRVATRFRGTFVPTTFFVSGNAFAFSTRTNGFVRVCLRVTSGDLFAIFRRTRGIGEMFRRRKVKRRQGCPDSPASNAA